MNSASVSPMPVAAGAMMPCRCEFNGAGHQSAWLEVGEQAFVLDRIDEVSVGLDDHRVSRTAEVKHGEPVRGAPSAGAASSVKRMGDMAGGDVALPRSTNVSSWARGDEDGQGIHYYMAPEARSASTRTSSYWPAASRSMGRRPPRLRLRACSQIWTPSSV